MSDFVTDLIEMLSVIDNGARTKYDIFTGPPLPTPHGRSFGGQVLGQAIASASKTAPTGRELHSMHGYFLRPGDSEQHMTFEVARLYDGRSFSTRRVQAFQDGNELMSMIASYQQPSEGLEHQDRFDMSTVAAPEEVLSVTEKYGHLADSRSGSWILSRPFEMRYIDPDIFLSVPKEPTQQRVWIKSRDALTDNAQGVHAAALAFASDYLLVEPILRRHGVPWATPGLRAASLDHAMWFHRDFRVDDWLLYVLDTPTAQGGRGLSHGKFYDQAGNLVASVSQEVMLRLPSQIEEASAPDAQ